MNHQQNEATLIGYRLFFNEDGYLMSEKTETPMKALEGLSQQELLIINAAVNGVRRAISEAERYVNQEIQAVNR